MLLSAGPFQHYTQPRSTWGTLASLALQSTSLAQTERDAALSRRFRVTAYGHQPDRSPGREPVWRLPACFACPE